MKSGLVVRTLSTTRTASRGGSAPPACCFAVERGRGRGIEGLPLLVREAAHHGRGIYIGMKLDTVVSGSAGKRRRNDDNGNDRSCKRSAVMRVCTTGEGNGSDLGAGGSGNEASGGEMEYDGRVAGIGVSAGKEGDMGRSGQIGGGGKRGVLM